MNILTWHAPSNNGAFQKDSGLLNPQGNGQNFIYSDVITTKPIMSFEYSSFNYIEQANMFDIDGIPMTDEQKKECKEVIDSIKPPMEWFKNVKKSSALQYLKSTDWYIVRKMDTGEEVPTDVREKRADARQYINDVENNAELATQTF